LAGSLLQDFGYEEDQNLPQMIWYAIQPLVALEPNRALALLEQCHDPRLFRSISRRIASDFEENSIEIVGLIQAIDRAWADGKMRHALFGLEGFELALNGLSGLAAPVNWDLLANSESNRIRSASKRFDSVFGEKLELSSNEWIQLMDKPIRRREAIRALAAFDDSKVGAYLVKEFRRMGREDREAAIGTLSSRVGLARPLLSAIKTGKIEPKALSAYYARQIHRLGDSKLSEQLESAWGKVELSSEAKREQIARWQERLTPSVLSSADIVNGRALFVRNCAACHRLEGEGSELGPDLGGANRQDLYYLLENLVDPSAVLPMDYRMTIITLADGSQVGGTIASRTSRTITLAGIEGERVIPISEIAKQEQLEQSTMPEGMLRSMTENEVRDLIGYLQTD